MTTILVVDDEHGLSDVLAATLSDAGFRVRTAANGQQGLERMREVRPDLVLLDYMMPVLDGGGVLEAMKADGTLASIPVIVVSSLPEPVIRERCLPFATFLRKPFTFEALLAAVERTLAR